MLELLKKIGLPATVAAIIASLVTLLPILFKIDERYAKAEELEAQIEKVEKDINALSTEVGKLAGAQEVLVSIMAAKNEKVAHTIVEERPRLTATPPAEPPAPTPTPQPAPEAANVQQQLRDVQTTLRRTQQTTQTINESYQNKK